MKRSILPFVLLLTLISVSNTIAINPISFDDPPESFESEVKALTAEEFANMRFKDFKTFIGREKMTLKERIGFTFTKRSIKKHIRKGELTGTEEINAAMAASFQMNWGAFALGALLWLIGVALVLLLFDDPEAWKSAVVGMAAALVFSLIFIW